MNFPLKTFVLRKIARTMKLFNFSLKNFCAASCEGEIGKDCKLKCTEMLFCFKKHKVKVFLVLFLGEKCRS